jgi:hypothetical protein
LCLAAHNVYARTQPLALSNIVSLIKSTQYLLAQRLLYCLLTNEKDEVPAFGFPHKRGATGSETQSLKRSIGTVSPAPVAHPMTHENWRVLMVGSESASASLSASAFIAAISDVDSEIPWLPCPLRSAWGIVSRFRLQLRQTLKMFSSSINDILCLSKQFNSQYV